MRTLAPGALRAALLLALLFLSSGCFETKQEFTINPDGSGKVIHQSTFQHVSLTGEDADGEEALKSAIVSMIEGASGVEAWRDVTYKRLDDGRVQFKGTAYFPNLSKFSIPNQTMLDFTWSDSGTHKVLTLRTNKSDKGSEGFRIQKATVDYSKLMPEERARKIKEERKKFQQMRPMLEGMVGTMKQEVTLHLPGQVIERSNFSDSSGACRIEFDGRKMLQSLEKLLENDAWAEKNMGLSSGSNKPEMDDELAGLMFASNAPVRALTRPGAALFDYKAELVAAKASFTALKHQLGIFTATAAPATNGGSLKNVRVAGVRLVRESDPKRGLRPFHHDAGYTLSIYADLPGSVLAITDKSRLETAIGDDGSNLVPERRQRFSFPTLTKDRSGVLFDVELLVPSVTVKGIRELSGVLEYTVAGGTKSVDLGFKELKAQEKGTELGAVIKSIKEGWKKDGSQQIELQLRTAPDNLKAVTLVSGDSRTLLERRGYSGAGNLFTLTYETPAAIPANAKLEVELYDQVQKFEAPFKLQNISLLGL